MLKDIVTLLAQAGSFCLFLLLSWMTPERSQAQRSQQCEPPTATMGGEEPGCSGTNSKNQRREQKAIFQLIGCQCCFLEVLAIQYNKEKGKSQQTCSLRQNQGNHQDEKQ